MNVWDESIGSRVVQEVGSCILKYLQTHETVIAEPDSCGRQNRNIKIAAMWMHIVQCPAFNIREVRHKFSKPGHSFLPSDSDFRAIEKKNEIPP
jgi:hypothetical protein